MVAAWSATGRPDVRPFIRRSTMVTTLPARYEPLRDIANIRDEIERFFREGFGPTTRELAAEAGGWTPEVDVEETEDTYSFHVELPGVKPEDISVSVEDGVLILSGERKFYEEKEAEGFRRVERRFGSFHRAMRLPAKVDPEAVEAHYAHGVLRVTVPKAEDTKPHRIEVKEE
jgi:HSP20 family protein